VVFQRTNVTPGINSTRDADFSASPPTWESNYQDVPVTFHTGGSVLYQSVALLGDTLHEVSYEYIPQGPHYLHASKRLNDGSSWPTSVELGAFGLGDFNGKKCLLTSGNAVYLLNPSWTAGQLWLRSYVSTTGWAAPEVIQSGAGPYRFPTISSSRTGLYLYWHSGNPITSAPMQRKVYPLTGTVTENMFLTGNNWISGDLTIASGYTVTAKGGSITYVLANKKITVAEGATLIVEGGAQFKFESGASMAALGTLQVQGTSSHPVTFTRSGNSGTWNGIDIGTFETDCAIEYALFSHASVPIAVVADNGTSVSHCTIDGGAIGIYVYTKGASERPPTQILNNTISGSSEAGILVDDGASQVIIQNNTLDGESSGEWGLMFQTSSPVRVTNNIMSNWTKGGIQCVSYASPAFVDGENGGHNCSVGNTVGLFAAYYSNPDLGNIEVGTNPGYNSLSGNTDYQITLQVYCDVMSQENYYRDGGPIPSADFNIAGGSTLTYEPYLESNPCSGDAHLIVGSPTGLRQGLGGDPSALSNPLQRLARRLRLQGRYADAITLLKTLATNHRGEVSTRRWIFSELLADYQMVQNTGGSARMSEYARTLLASQPNDEVKRILRDVLAGALVHEGDASGALAALNETINLYSATSAELFALYKKVILALNLLNNIELAQGSLQRLQQRFPENGLTSLAAVLVAIGPRAADPRSIARGVPPGEDAADNSLPSRYALRQNYPNPFTRKRQSSTICLSHRMSRWSSTMFSDGKWLSLNTA
jgi:parallel beta-helix repeat protein